LPEHVRQQARAAYRLFAVDPNHPSLRFKAVHTRQPVYLARVGLGYRALAVRDGDVVIWFWIGSHAECDRILANR
jgi:hypothetical protein